MSRFAVCIMREDGNSGVSGTVAFTQEGPNTPCTITAKITGLTAGLHGFHIHEFGDLTNGCVTAGPHYNPHGKTHGGPSDEVRHVGDLGNIEAGDSGVGTYTLTDSMVTLFGELTVVGRSVVCHKDTDCLGKS
jgi:Cu-Zn family superoxide dismutase